MPRYLSAPPSESTQDRWATWPRNADHEARPAACLSWSNWLLRDATTTSNRAFSRVASCADIRLSMVSKIAVFTSARICAAISFRVENPGSSKEALTRASSATLMRSGGLFFTAASARITSAATIRARGGSNTTPYAFSNQLALHPGCPLRSGLG